MSDGGILSGSVGGSGRDLLVLRRLRGHPDPVNMPSTDVACWECGRARRGGRDKLGHAYCLDHRYLWGSVYIGSVGGNQLERVRVETWPGGAP